MSERPKHAPMGPCKACGDPDDHYGEAHSSAPKHTPQCVQGGAFIGRPCICGASKRIDALRVRAEGSNDE